MMNTLEFANSNPYAIAYINGGKNNINLNGVIEFIPWANGSIIKIEVAGLPTDTKNNFFGFHIHENGICNIEVNFETAGTHYNPDFDAHPNHIGDLPMIYSNNGYSFMLYYTSRFTPEDVVGKSIIIHNMVDDMKTQPAGNSGDRIACGVIRLNATSNRWCPYYF